MLEERAAKLRIFMLVEFVCWLLKLLEEDLVGNPPFYGRETGKCVDWSAVF